VAPQELKFVGYRSEMTNVSFAKDHWPKLHFFIFLQTNINIIMMMLMKELLAPTLAASPL